MKIPDHHLWSDAELVNILRAEARRLDRRPRRADLEVATVNRPHYRTFATRFGSWTKALKVAGLIHETATWRDLSGPARWTREELIDALVAKAAHVHGLPTRDDFSKASTEAPHYRTFATFFGSWTAALRAAGLI